jgi:hypothetical protein
MLSNFFQYTYWEKVSPWESYLFFSWHTTPLLKNWDEDAAYKRDMYDISYGRSHGMVNMYSLIRYFYFKAIHTSEATAFVFMQVVDDLRKVPTIDQPVTIHIFKTI